MTAEPVVIAIETGSAPSLAAHLDVRHDLRVFSGSDADAAIGRALAEAAVVVSPVFKPAWRPPARPRLVHSDGAGVNGIDLASLPPGCRVCNVYGHERGLAEHVFMLILALQRNLLRQDAALRRGDWSPELPHLSELRGRHLLLLGLGHIGSEVVRWARFLGMRVSGLTRSPSPERMRRLGLARIGGLGELHDFLPEADFVVVAIPSAPETVDLIGAGELARMKPSAYLVNVGRAAVVNERALYEALAGRRISGAGLDVWYQYPAGAETRMPSLFPFQDLDNVIMTPHKATIETMEFRWREIAKNIGRFARGEPLENVVATA